MRMHADDDLSTRTDVQATDAWVDAIRRVRSEYTEMAGMRLTQEQAGRLFGLDPFACSLVLGWPVDERFLRRSRGLYIKN